MSCLLPEWSGKTALAVMDVHCNLEAFSKLRSIVAGRAVLLFGRWTRVKPSGWALGP